MNTHLYHVQSQQYQVVLYSLLKSRLGERYQHRAHFGGSLYLFLRGMAGTDSRIITANHDQGAAGVYVHRPPQRVTELLSLALERPREAAQKLDEMLGGAQRARSERECSMSEDLNTPQELSPRRAARGAPLAEEPSSLIRVRSRLRDWPRWASMTPLALAATQSVSSSQESEMSVY